MIVPVHRGGEAFETCISSIKEALEPGDEFIVVADGEGDGSWRKAESLGAKIVHCARNGGPAAARNAGAQAARGSLLYFVDADVKVPSDCLRRIKAKFENDESLAALIGSYDLYPTEPNFTSRLKNLFNHWVHQQASGEISTFWGACGAIRRQVFLDVGGFSASYDRPSIEDIELGYRLRAASHRIRLEPDIQVTHLKRWIPMTLLKTDFMDRAVPWTELIVDQIVRRKGGLAGDLNLGFRYRLSLLLSFAMIALYPISVVWLPALALLVPMAAAFVYIHFPLVMFFRKRLGWRSALKSLVWRFCYDIYCGFGFAYGTGRYAHRTMIRLLSTAFEKLDPLALGVATGTVAGGYLALIAALCTIRGANRDFGPGLLGQFLFGYEASWRGCALGLVYGFCCGFIAGFAIAALRNALIRVYLGTLRVFRFFEILSRR